jgi:hypothetical protein
MLNDLCFVVTTISISRTVMSNNKVMSEQYVGKGVEGSCHAQLDTVLILAWRAG